jgi:hypothetical protein
MLNAWMRKILCRRLRDGNPRLKDQLEDLKHVGKMTFWKIQRAQTYGIGRK